MNLLKHRGYYGSIEASTEDNCLYGKLLFIRALVNYEGQTVAELSTAFRQAVDDYLADCEAKGCEPEAPCKGSFSIRIGHELHMAASLTAMRENISLNDLARRALSNYVQQHG